MCGLSVLINYVCITNRNQNLYERYTFIECESEIQDIQQHGFFFYLQGWWKKY